MLKIKFGTDGWRAVMDKEYTFENVERLAQAFADYMKDKKSKASEKNTPRIVIGYDFRDRSENYAASFARVLLGNDMEVTLSDRAVPTPAVSQAIIDYSFDAGIAITASHNPATYNGVKIKDSDGSSADPSITNSVEELIDRNPVKKDPNADLTRIHKDILSVYLEHIKKYVDFDLFQRKPLRVLVDSMHGVGESHLQQLLENTVVNVTTVRGERDIHFGGVAPEPILKNLTLSAQLMKQDMFDIAIVTDGDADRVAALRPGGEFVSPGTILSLILLHLAQDLAKKGTVVTTVSNTSLIYRVAQKLALPVEETPVGFKYICEIMRRENVLIGGEESGGLAFQGHMLERDGILSGLLLIQMMSYRQKTFEEILRSVEEEFGKFHYTRNDLRVAEDVKPKLKTLLNDSSPKTLAGSRVLKKMTKDGWKFVLENDAWLLFRLSGTEPLLRIYAESTDASQVPSLIQWGQSLIQNAK